VLLMNRVNTDKAPQAIGPYSQAVRVGGLLFISGQIPLDPETGRLVEGNIEQQAARVLKNMEAILAEAGLGFADVAKTTVYLQNMDDFGKVNQIYGECFRGSVLPARSAVQVGRLPKGALVEIEAIALSAGSGTGSAT